MSCKAEVEVGGLSIKDQARVAGGQFKEEKAKPYNDRAN